MPLLSVYMIRAALIHLGVGFTLGAALLANKGLMLNPGIWRWLEPHIELLVFGWTMQLAMGVAFWALPRFTGERRYGKEALGWWSFMVFNGGVVMTAAGRWAGASLDAFALAGRTAVLLAVIAFSIVIWERVKPLATYVVPTYPSTKES